MDKWGNLHLQDFLESDPETLALSLSCDVFFALFPPSLKAQAKTALSDPLLNCMDSVDTGLTSFQVLNSSSVICFLDFFVGVDFASTLLFCFID